MKRKPHHVRAWSLYELVHTWLWLGVLGALLASVVYFAATRLPGFVEARVRTCVENLQVGKHVVQPITVDVVNVFTLRKPSSEMSLHDESVLGLYPPVAAELPISTTVYAADEFAGDMAGFRAVDTSADLGPICVDLKCCAAMLAGPFDTPLSAPVAACTTAINTLVRTTATCGDLEVDSADAAHSVKHRLAPFSDSVSWWRGAVAGLPLPHSRKVVA